jgi:hypothetical protein
MSLHMSWHDDISCMMYISCQFMQYHDIHVWKKNPFLPYENFPTFKCNFPTFKLYNFQFTIDLLNLFWKIKMKTSCQLWFIVIHSVSQSGLRLVKILGLVMIPNSNVLPNNATPKDKIWSPPIYITTHIPKSREIVELIG